MAGARASNSKLAPGEDTIDRARPKKQADGTWIVKWSYRPADGRQPHRYTNKAPTRGEALRRARDKLDDLKATGSGSTWKLSDSVADYAEKVSKPAIQKARLVDSSRDRYTSVLKLLLGQCPFGNHQHVKSLKGHTIHSATRKRVLIDCLEEIARLHGPGTAHHSRIVLGRYVLDHMETDDLIEVSPIRGRKIDLSGGRDKTRSRGGVALTAEQWNAVIDYLLTLDPAEGLAAPKQGMYTLADKVAVKRNAVDLALLQAVTGMRVGEASAATWAMVDTDDDGAMVMHLPAEITKTKKGRDVRIADRSISERLLARRGDAEDSWPVIGSPAKPEGRWDQRQRSEHTAKLYDQMAEALGIPELHVERTHVWRATINSITAGDGVPEVVRTAHLGHTATVNRSRYTDVRDMSPLTDSLRRLRVD